MLSKVMETDHITIRVVMLVSKKNTMLRLLHKQKNNLSEQMVTQLSTKAQNSIKLVLMAHMF